MLDGTRDPRVPLKFVFSKEDEEEEEAYAQTTPEYEDNEPEAEKKKTRTTQIITRRGGALQVTPRGKPG